MRRTARGTLLSSDRPQWWFIATAPLACELGEGGSAEVIAEVRAGRVGISLVGDDETRPYSERVAGPGPVGVRLQRVGDNPIPRYILFRSCAPDNRPSVIEVLSIRLDDPP